MKPAVTWVLAGSLAGLLLAGCGPGSPRMPLHAAVEDGNYPAVRQHVAARSDLNAKDKAGRTPLHLAVLKGDLPMVQLLADAGADPARTGPGGQTVLEAARAQGQTAVVAYLEGKLQAAAAGQAEKAATERRGRGLIDGGLGVSDVLDAH